MCIFCLNVVLGETLYINFYCKKKIKLTAKEAVGGDK